MFGSTHIVKERQNDQVKQIEIDREMISPEKDARLIKMGGILSHYVTLSGKEIKRARDKIFYYLMGLCFLFTMISIPLATFFLDPAMQWIIVIPPLIVILLSYLRERKASRTNNLYIVSSAFPGCLPGNRDNKLQNGNSVEIEMYWGYRPVAVNDIRQIIKNCKNELFISGMGLNTVADALNDPSVVRSISSQLTTNPVFSVTIVMLDRAHTIRAGEAGGSFLSEQLRRGRKSIETFRSEITKRIPNNNGQLIDIRTYDERTIPRHFILKADETIIAGSYLSHRRGSHSYLIKLKKTRGEGLYELFNNEIKYLKKHSVPIQMHTATTQEHMNSR